MTLEQLLMSRVIQQPFVLIFAQEIENVLIDNIYLDIDTLDEYASDLIEVYGFYEVIKIGTRSNGINNIMEVVVL